MKRLLIPTTLSALLCSSVLHAQPAAGKASAADVTTEVRRLMKKGGEEYGSEHWEAARTAYLEAWGLRQHFAVAANLADVEMRLGLYRDAAEHWEFHLANLPEGRESLRAEGEKRLAECRAHLAKIRVSVNVTGAKIRLDAREIGTAPLGHDVWTEPGAHALTVESEGYVTDERKLSPAAGDTFDVSVALTTAPGAASTSAPAEGTKSAPPADSGHVDSSGIPARTLVIAGTGVLAAAGIGIGIGYELASNSAASDTTRLQNEIDALDPKHQGGVCSAANPPEQCSALKDKIHTTNQDSTIATVAFISGGVLAAGTVAMLLLWPTSSHSETALSVSPWASRQASGATLRVRF